MTSQSDQLKFDLESALSAIVPISSHIPEEAMSAGLLGTERSGHGVVIREDGLIATIGYLIAEAESVWIGNEEGAMLPGFAVGYDYETGFGLVRPTMPLKRPCLSFGRSADLQLHDPVLVAGSGGAAGALLAQVAAKQEFAGRWEYLIDEAIYTVPAHTDWAGAALLNMEGNVCGIGSLLVQGRTQTESQTAAANMFVPTDLLVPIIDEICAHGRQSKPPRPWLGLLIHDDDEQLLVAGVYRHCPGDRAGIQPGDIISELNGRPPGSLAQFFRAMWGLGSAGVPVPLTILRDGEIQHTVVQSGDRAAFSTRGTVN